MYLTDILHTNFLFPEIDNMGANNQVAKVPEKDIAPTADAQATGANIQVAKVPENAIAPPPDAHGTDDHNNDGKMEIVIVISFESREVLINGRTRHVWVPVITQTVTTETKC